jgi:hypothetical protein
MCVNPVRNCHHFLVYITTDTVTIVSTITVSSTVTVTSTTHLPTGVQ